mmetsp:Transcript_77104/g.238061  ORF Transcript_77104/g.238061 Transcript_77104/m.238061 type:complete len:248 (-) Transcript_77104:245-988(-)
MKSMSIEADSGRPLSEEPGAPRCLGPSARLLRSALNGLPGGRAGAGGSLPAAFCWISAVFATSSSTQLANFSHISSQRWNCLALSSALPSSSIHLASVLSSTRATLSAARLALSSTRLTSSCTRPVTCTWTSCSFFAACFSLESASAASESTSFLSALATSSCLMEFHMSRMSWSMLWTSWVVTQLDRASRMPLRRLSCSSSLSPWAATCESRSSLSPISSCLSCAWATDAWRDLCCSSSSDFTLSW